MHLKKFSLNSFLLFAFLISSSVLWQSCGTTANVVAVNPNPVAHNNTPDQKISSKTKPLYEDNKEPAKISVNHNENVKASALFTKYADILGVDASKLTNEKLYALIDEWWHVPYHYAGNSKKGIDCSGFSCMVWKNVYGREIVRGSREMYNETERVKRDDLQEGDLVFFRIRHGQVSHVGVYLQNNMFAHASVRSGVTISSLDDPYYKKVFTSGGRLK